MQRAQRTTDNPALDVAIAVGNALRQPVVVFLAPIPLYPHGKLRQAFVSSKRVARCVCFLGLYVLSVLSRLDKDVSGWVNGAKPGGNLVTGSEIRD